MALDPGLTVVGGLAILCLIVASAFFSSSSDPHRLLVTVLVGNNVANIAAASIATALLVQVLPPGEAVTGATIFTSGFVLVIGEIAPKSYAVSNAEPWALRVARPLSGICTAPNELLKWISALMSLG